MPVVSENPRILKVLADRMPSKSIEETLEPSEAKNYATWDFSLLNGSEILDFFDDEISIPVIKRPVEASRHIATRESIPKSCEFVNLVLPQLKERQIKQQLHMTWNAFQQSPILDFSAGSFLLLASPASTSIYHKSQDILNHSTRHSSFDRPSHLVCDLPSASKLSSGCCFLEQGLKFP